VQQRLYQAVQITLGIDNLFNYRPKVYQYNSPFTTGTSFTVGVAVELEQLFKHL
jgi:putative tonB-dependent receptor hmuR